MGHKGKRERGTWDPNNGQKGNLIKAKSYAHRERQGVVSVGTRTVQSVFSGKTANQQLRTVNHC